MTPIDALKQCRDALAAVMDKSTKDSDGYWGSINMPSPAAMRIADAALTAADTALAALSEPQDERAAFEAHFPHFDFAKVKDGWGRDQYAHPHIESTWFGWQARASLDPTPQPEPEPMIDGWPLYSMLPPPASKQGEVPMPPIDIQRSLGLDAVRYVAGWPESYVKEYARAYGDARALAAVREPLSDEQIASITVEATGWRVPMSPHFALARAIERAHGIGITSQAQQEPTR